MFKRTSTVGRSHRLPHVDTTWYPLAGTIWEGPIAYLMAPGHLGSAPGHLGSLGVTWGHLGSLGVTLAASAMVPMVPNGSQWFPMVPNSHLLSHHGLRNQHHHWHHSLNPGLLAKTWVAQSPGIAATLQESNTLLLKMLINAQKLSILSWFTY